MQFRIYDSRRAARANHGNLPRLRPCIGIMNCPVDVAQASSPASSPGISPGVRAGGETPPQLAAGTTALRGSWKAPRCGSRSKRVREWWCHSLPVIAMGSIPHIYRHDSLSLRAIPTPPGRASGAPCGQRLPGERSQRASFDMVKTSRSFPA